MNITDLPIELQEHILSFLSVLQELQTASTVCTHWREICRSLYTVKHRIFRDHARAGRLVWRRVGGGEPVGLVRNGHHHRNGGHHHPFRSSQQAGGARVVTPPPRHLHRAVLHGHHMFIHGGDTTSGIYNGLYKLDILTNTWSKVIAREGVPPTPRSRFAMTKYGHHVFVTGGCNMSRGYVAVEYNDIYVYDLVENVWYSAGNLLQRRYTHGCVCLESEGDTIRLVLVGGLGTMCNMAVNVELCTLSRDSNNRYRVSNSVLFPNTDTRMFHTQIKLDDHRVFVFGGRTMTELGDDPSVPVVRQDASILTLSPDYTSLQISSVPMLNSNISVYSGLYPVVLDDFVVVGGRVIYLQQVIYTKESRELPGFYVLDEGRCQTGLEISKNRYFHTFILDISEVGRGGAAKWVEVENNPPAHAPFSSRFHTSVVAGDSIVVFGGTVQDQRTKKSQDNNALYRVTVTNR